MWEYHIETVKGQYFKVIEDRLNELGSEGWEIMACNLKKPEKFGTDWELFIITKRKINEEN